MDTVFDQSPTLRCGDDAKFPLPALKEMIPEKIPPMALHLASDGAANITGQIFAVRNNEIFRMSQLRIPGSSGH